MLKRYNKANSMIHNFYRSIDYCPRYNERKKNRDDEYYVSLSQTFYLDQHISNRLLENEKSLYIARDGSYQGFK